MDSIRTFSSYVDVIIMRTPERGEAARAAKHLDATPRPVPIINAGSGPDQHPTQALLDIYTLERSFEAEGGIDGKTIVMMGDLRRGRTVRSLSYLLTQYRDVEIVFVAPESLGVGGDVKDYLSTRGVAYRETDDLNAALRGADAVYATRLQSEYETGVSGPTGFGRFRIGCEQLEELKDTAIIMHPLPRGPELDPVIDTDPRVMYWRQERNGMWMRAALLVKIFDVEDQV